MSTPNPFAQPSSGGDKFNPKDHPEWVGKLMLVYPREFIQGIPTTHGETDAVSANIVFLDHQVDGELLKLAGAMLFGKVMVSQTRNAVPDGMVLGRLGQGQNTKGNPPWLLLDHSDADVAAAQQYIAANPSFVAPTQPSGPPTSGGFGQQATASADPWNVPAPAAAPAQTWGAPAPAPATLPGAGWPAGLADFLVSKGVDIANVPDEATARMIAANYS